MPTPQEDTSLTIGGELPGALFRIAFSCKLNMPQVDGQVPAVVAGVHEVGQVMPTDKSGLVLDCGNGRVVTLPAMTGIA